MPKFQPLNGVCRKTLTDELPMLDLMDCYRAISSTYNLVWQVLWADDTSLTYYIHRDALGRLETFEIAYQVTTDSGSVESRKQVLPFTSVPQKLGGVRWWLVCSCGRRCRTIYLRPASCDWRCRQCTNLIYRSQLLRGRRFERQRNMIDRQLRRERKPWHFPHLPIASKPFDPKDF